MWAVGTHHLPSAHGPLTLLPPACWLTEPAGLLTLSGLSVYLEFGLAIPRSGGEKNYLERVFRRPQHLATSVFAVQMVLLGFSSGNSLAFGRYVLLAVGHPMPDGWVPRAIAVNCITLVILLHAVFPKWGLRL